VLRLLRYAYLLNPQGVRVNVASRILTAALTVAAPLLVGQAVGRLPGVLHGGPDGAFVGILVAVVVVLGVSNVISLLAEVVSTRTAELIDRDISLRLGHALSSDPGLATVDDAEVQTKVQKVRGRNWEIKVGSRQVQGPAIATVLSLTGGAVALGVTLNWWAPVVMVACWVAEAAFITQLISRQMDLWSGQTEPQKHAWYAFEQAMGKSAKEIRIFGLAGFLRKRHWDNLTTAYLPYWRRRRRHALVDIGVLAGRTAVTAGVLAYTGWTADQGRLSLTALATSLPLILTIGSADSWMFGMLGRGKAVLGWLEELAAVPPTAGVPGESTSRVDVRESTALPGERSRVLPPSIVFDEVSFAYPGSDHLILDGLSLELRAGSASALVGVNGAGKSTLVKLLAAGYLPTRGRILVDGVDLAGLDLDERHAWQRRVAPITQDFVRLPLPAGDNVELGTGFPWSGSIDLSDQPRSSWPDTAALDTTAGRAGIADLIARLPSGWATPLDKTIPGGTDLSGGEWQRIGLARALRAVAVSASVLVLDEPAAALDVEAEAHLVTGYLDLAQHITSLVISHRFSVVRPVPQIFVLEHGRIVEQGPHEELMARGGRYRTMFSLQASRYVEAAAAGQIDEVAR
jgi:ATP-binding cassette, subfamily B, bacterial